MTFTSSDFQKTAIIPGGFTDAVMAKFKRYHALLLEWSPKINLVAPSTLEDAWERHFMDSAQLVRPELLGPRFEEVSTLVDLGSGAGFPGMVLAIMGVPNVTLVERDIRKCSFLRTVAAETKTEVEILNVGAGTIEDRQFDIITARALADTGALINLSTKLRKTSTVCWFLKGKNVDEELTKAQKEWAYDVARFPSVTSAESTIICLSNIKSKRV